MAAPSGNSGLQKAIWAVRERFNTVISASRQSDACSTVLQPVAASLHNECQRFDLWCKNLGAYQSGHASLEYRLRDASKVYAYALRILADLEDCLNLTLQESSAQQLAPESAPRGDISCNADLEEGPEDDSEDEFLDSYNSKPLADILIENVRASLDHLYRLSFQIRNPATRIDSSRVLNFQDLDPDTHVDALACYAPFDLAHIKELLLDLGNRGPSDRKVISNDLGDIVKKDGASPPESEVQVTDSEMDSYFLVQRLATANNIRRRQFRYWQTHQDKPAMVGPQDAVEEAGLTPLPNRALSLATTEATKAVEDKIDLTDNRSLVSSATYAMMQKQSDHEDLRIPPFPRWLQDKKEFECPYCRILCPGSMSRKSAWETHILRDLRPYTCTFEKCLQADQLFDTFQSWRLHETRLHGERSVDDHATSISPSAEVSNSHLKGTHPSDSVNIELRTCPFCLEPEKTSAHVGAHLQRVAFFALPQIQPLNETGSISDKNSNVARGSGLQSIATTESISADDSELVESAKSHLYADDPRPELGPLPQGYEIRQQLDTGRLYYVDHNTRRTSWNDPRLLDEKVGVAQEEVSSVPELLEFYGEPMITSQDRPSSPLRSEKAPASEELYSTLKQLEALKPEWFDKWLPACEALIISLTPPITLSDYQSVRLFDLDLEELIHRFEAVDVEKDKLAMRVAEELRKEVTNMREKLRGLNPCNTSDNDASNKVPANPTTMINQPGDDNENVTVTAQADQDTASSPAEDDGRSHKDLPINMHHADDECEEQKENFILYYMTQNNTLRRATELMIQNHDFHATQRQWERKIKQWGYRSTRAARPA